MESYLQIKDRTFPLSKVIEMLGAKGIAREVSLCQETRSGVLKANVFADPNYPAIDLDFLPKDALLPISVSSTEQPTEGDAPVRTYLFDRDDHNFAYSDLDIRPNFEVEKEVRAPEIVIRNQFQCNPIVKYDLECESCDCCYNHGGECRFAMVHERKPRIDDDGGCIDYNCQEGEI